VGIGLPDDDDAVERIDIAALKTVDHPRRDLGIPHHDGQGRGEVLAVAALHVEKEKLHRVTVRWTGFHLQRIAVIVAEVGLQRAGLQEG